MYLQRAAVSYTQRKVEDEHKTESFRDSLIYVFHLSSEFS